MRNNIFGDSFGKGMLADLLYCIGVSMNQLYIIIFNQIKEARIWLGQCIEIM